MIGQLRSRLGLYTPSVVSDDLGGTVTNWAFHSAVWGAVEPRTLTETSDAGRLTVIQTYKVTIRYRPDFPQRARLIWRGRLLLVIAASDPDTRGERLHLMCEEERR